MTAFDSTKLLLSDLLKDIISGKIQLPDFQRGWVWDDDHIRDLLVSIAKSFPVGAVMLLESGGEVRFQTRPVEGLEDTSRNIYKSRKAYIRWATTVDNSYSSNGNNISS